MEKENTKIGSEPSKLVYGNTPDKPDNIKNDQEPSSTDAISRGAHQENLKKKDDTSSGQPNES